MSKQHTICAGCGKDKHTPLRIDTLGGYICLTCADAALSELAALQADRERLEAVAVNGWRLSCDFGSVGNPNHWICYSKDWSQPEGEGETYNAAIDAAREPKP